MEERLPCNEFGQPIGYPIPEWTERPLPSSTPMVGRYCCVETLDASCHAADLWAAYAEAPDGRDWTYLVAGPFSGLEDYTSYVQRISESRDPFHYAILDRATGKAVGTVALMRIDPVNGVIEVGHVIPSSLDGDSSRLPSDAGRAHPRPWLRAHGRAGPPSRPEDRRCVSIRARRYNMVAAHAAQPRRHGSDLSSHAQGLRGLEVSSL